jgi:hypothetical protein
MLTPSLMGASTLFGLVMHGALERHYIGWDIKDIRPYIHSRYNAYVEEHANRIKEDDLPKWILSRDNCVKVFGEYVNYYPRDKEPEIWVDPRTGEPAIEYEFKVPVFTPKGYKSRKYQVAGKVDMIEHDNGWLWVWDHKSRDIIGGSYAQRLQLDIQARSYCHNLQIYTGMPVAGFVYNSFRRKPPGLPSINKDGSISKKKIDCDLGTYLDFLWEHDQKLEWMSDERRKEHGWKSTEKMPGVAFLDYEDEIERLRGIEFFRRDRWRYDQRDYEIVQLEIYHLTKLLRENPFPYRNDRACDHFGGCAYRPLCMRLDASDLYEIRDIKHTELSSSQYLEPLGRGFKIHKSPLAIPLGEEGMLEDLQ